VVKFEVGETVRLKKKVGNIIYFKRPDMVVVNFGCDNKRSVNVSRLKKTTKAYYYDRRKKPIR